MSPMPVYLSIAQEGYADAVTGSFESTLTMYPDEWEALTHGRLPKVWSNWALHWYKEYGSTIPDVSWFSLTFACAKEIAEDLWPDGVPGPQRLPFTVDGAAWVFALPQTFSDKLNPELSRFEWFEHEGRPVLVGVPWVTVVDPELASLDLFRLALEPRGPTYFTEHFVRRIKSLGLQGLEFKHVGYIVDSPEHAVPEPPRPPVAAPAPPRWPGWREPAVERVQASQAAGAAWLQRQGLPSAPPAADALAALAQAIEAARSPQARLGPKALKAFLAEVGGAWGHLLHRDCGWRWVELPVSSRTWRLGLASPEGRHALCLDQVIERQLAASSPSTLTLMFHMIAAGSLPDAQPGEHQVLG